MTLRERRKLPWMICRPSPIGANAIQTLVPPPLGRHNDGKQDDDGEEDTEIVQGFRGSAL